MRKRSSMILLTIILPAYNAEKYISESIDSILGQTFIDFELLIADDGSTDNTKRIIDRYTDSRIKKLHNEKNLGKTATVEKLYKYAGGKYISIHDADDISKPSRFELQVAALEANPALVMCGTSFITIDEKGDIIEENAMDTNYESIKQNIKYTSQFHGPTMVFRKEITDKLGEIYRPYFKDNNEDTDLAFRLIQYGEAYNLAEKVYLYRILSTSLCRRDVSVRTRNLYKVVAFLGEQREKSGTDCLMRGKPEEADAFFAEITKAYADDKAKIHREAAAYLMYWKLYSRAIDESIKGIMKRPFDLINWRTLFYCARKSVFK